MPVLETRSTLVWLQVQTHYWHMCGLVVCKAHVCRSRLAAVAQWSTILSSSPVTLFPAPPKCTMQYTWWITYLHWFVWGMVLTYLTSRALLKAR